MVANAYFLSCMTLSQIVPADDHTADSMVMTVIKLLSAQ